MRNPLGKLAATSLLVGAGCVAVTAEVPAIERTAVLAAAGGVLVAVNEGAACLSGLRRWPERPPVGAVRRRRELSLVLLPAVLGAALSLLVVNLALASSLGGTTLIALGGAAAVAAVALLGLLALPAGDGLSPTALRAPSQRGRRHGRGARPSPPSRPVQRGPWS